MKNLLKKCKYKITYITDKNGNPKKDKASLGRLNKIGTADILSDTLLFFYPDRLTGFRTSPIESISETDDGVCVETQNTRYSLAYL